MFTLQILVLGKLKEAYWNASEAEYLKRLRPYAKVEILELPEEPFKDGDDREKVKLKEAEKIKKHLDKEALIFTFEEKGKEFDSPSFAKFLETHTTRGEKIIFVIGGPLGLHKSIVEKANANISLSKLTFPHQMVRTILIEQIYRAVTILKEKNYHY